MTTDFEKAVQRAAARINNLYATSYMDVHFNAGPWGTKQDADVAAVIREEIENALEPARKRS